MFDKKSDYALNKQDRDAIICKSVKGVHIRLSRADFASEEEFLKWKVWSDEDYHATEKAGRVYHDLGLSVEDWAIPSAPSVEELLLDAANMAEQDTARAFLVLRIKNSLTEKQFRRLCLYYLEGKSQHEIAKLGGSVSAVFPPRLHSAEKNLKNFLRKVGGIGAKNKSFLCLRKATLFS